MPPVMPSHKQRPAPPPARAGAGTVKDGLGAKTASRGNEPAKWSNIIVYHALTVCCCLIVYIMVAGLPPGDGTPVRGAKKNLRSQIKEAKTDTILCAAWARGWSLRRFHESVPMLQSMTPKNITAHFNCAVYSSVSWCSQTIASPLPQPPTRGTAAISPTCDTTSPPLEPASRVRRRFGPR